jgi:Repeat of unknown function (DUF346)
MTQSSVRTMESFGLRTPDAPPPHLALIAILHLSTRQARDGWTVSGDDVVSPLTVSSVGAKIVRRFPRVAAPGAGGSMSWSPWVPHSIFEVPGSANVLLSAPAAVGRSSDAADLYATTDGNQLMQYSWTRQRGFAGWFVHGGSAVSRPIGVGAGSRNPDHEVVAVTTTDGHVQVKEWTRDGDWTPMRPIGAPGTTVLGPPAVICRSNDAINVYARRSDNKLVQIYWTRDGNWLRDWHVHEDGGLISSGPAAVSLGADHEALFARGLDNRLWWKEWHADRGWSRWTQIGGATTFQDRPAAISRNRDAINVYARNAANKLIQLVWTRSGGWDANWVVHEDGGVLSAGPTAARIDDRSEFVFARGTDSRLWHKWWHDDGVLTMPLHLKYVIPQTSFTFTAAQVTEALQLVYSGTLVWAPVLSVEQLNMPLLQDINDQGCNDFGFATSFNQGQDALFRLRNGVGPDDIVVYFVRTLSGGLAGCAVHPGDRPGCIVANNASRWVAAHEVGHVLGNGHDSSSTDWLMFPVDANTRLPPDLGAGQVGEGRFIRR